MAALPSMQTAAPEDWLMTALVQGYGDKGRSIETRFWAFVIPEPNSGCWLWLGYLNACGYGVFGIKGKSFLAHRLSYAFSIGHFDQKKRVLHRCDVPCCVNPEHLFLGTQGDNVHDMERKGRSYHPRGEDHGRAKLTEVQVRCICTDGRPAAVVARDYGISKYVVLQIRHRKIWKHVR